MMVRNAQTEHPSWRESLIPSPKASSHPFQIPLRHSAINEKFASLGREIDRSDGAGSRTTVYNAYGEVTSERFPLATNSSAVISRTYDSLGRPKTILLGGVTAASYAYDAATGRYTTVGNNSATVYNPIISHTKSKQSTRFLR